MTQRSIRRAAERKAKKQAAKTLQFPAPELPSALKPGAPSSRHLQTFPDKLDWNPEPPDHAENDGPCLLAGASRSQSPELSLLYRSDLRNGPRYLVSWSAQAVWLAVVRGAIFERHKNRSYRPHGAPYVR